MKALIVVIGICAAAGALSTRAEAQNYPWCAYYTGNMGGSSNCGFTTFAQCMADVSGIGGICMRNTQYVPAPGRRPYHRPHRRRYRS